MKNHLLQNIKILVLGILTLACLVVAVIGAIPEKKADLIMQEPFLVSSSQILANSNLYSTQITGVIKNTTGKPINIQDVLVTVSNGKTRQTISLGGVSLPPRTTWSYLDSWESHGDYNRVLSIKAVLDGEEIPVSNHADTSFSFSGVTVFALLIGGVLAFFLTHACKIRYYMMQEDRFKASQDQ